METVETTVPEGDRTELMRGSAELVAQVMRLEVTDQKTLNMAAEYRRQAKARLTAIADKVGGRVLAVHKAWKALREMQTELEKPWQAVVAICSQAIGQHELRQREAARKAEQEAARQRRAAEEEARQRHAQQLEAARLEAELRRAEEAGALLAAGDDDGAAALLEVPVRPATVVPPVRPVIQPPVVEVAHVRAAGTSVSISHKATLVDLDQLIVAAAKDPTLRCLLSFNQVAANGMAKALGSRMHVPGVEVHEAPAVRQR